MAKVSEQNEGMVKDKYVVGLEGLHGAFAEGMGKPVYAPVDLSKSGLKILDSGCNTGTLSLTPASRYRRKDLRLDEVAG